MTFAAWAHDHPVAFTVIAVCVVLTVDNVVVNVCKTIIRRGRA